MTIYFPRAVCFGDDPLLVSAMALTDFGIGLACFALALALLFQVTMRRSPDQRQVLLFRIGAKIFWYLGSFSSLVLCIGFTFVINGFSIWWPFYWPLVYAKGLTLAFAYYALFVIAFR